MVTSEINQMTKSTGMLSQRDVLLTLNAPDRLQELRAQLLNLEHDLHVAVGIEQLSAHLDAYPNHVVLVDDALIHERTDAHFDALQDVLYGSTCAVLSRRTSFAARMASVKLGARTFLQLPLDAPMLSERLDAMTLHTEQEPPQIFLLQLGQNANSEPLMSCLESAGMHVSLFDSPQVMFDALETHRPELFLFDHEGTSDAPLLIARAIRQDAHLLGIPIILATSDTRINAFLEAMRSGCDNIIQKPVNTEHLLTAVMPRVNRFRKLRASMAIDGLTGLFNHSHFKERLQTHISQSLRTHVPISLAMLDVDSFKQINDNYGHPAGDSVLRHLAQLLKGRLRRTDILGRYGGDEFAVLMLDTEIHDAGRVMEQVRQRFAELEHHSPHATFHTSFSCGIASFPTYSSDTALTIAADQALYEAKKQGKNQVYARA